MFQHQRVYAASLWITGAYCKLCAASVADRSNAVNTKLQLRRDQIEELNQVCSRHCNWKAETLGVIAFAGTACRFKSLSRPGR